jgi:hypothetical protein
LCINKTAKGISLIRCAAECVGRTRMLAGRLLLTIGRAAVQVARFEVAVSDL